MLEYGGMIINQQYLTLCRNVKCAKKYAKTPPKKTLESMPISKEFNEKVAVEWLMDFGHNIYVVQIHSVSVYLEEETIRCN